jgi:hypothetical protein
MMDEIYQLYKKGVIDLLYQRGIISSSAYTYFLIYEDWVKMKDQKDVIFLLSQKYKRSEASIYLALKRFR